MTRPASDRDLNAIYAQDTEANGVCRKAFSAAWFQRTKTRQTLLLGPDSATSAFATYRVCREGVKIGPLHAGASDQPMLRRFFCFFKPVFCFGKVL